MKLRRCKLEVLPLKERKNAMQYASAVVGDDPTVVCGDFILLMNHDKVRKIFTQNAPNFHEKLLNLALRGKFGSLWVAPGSAISMLAREFPDRFTSPTDYIDTRFQLNDDAPTCVHMWRRQGSWEEKRTIQIFFPEHDPRWRLEKLSAEDILMAIHTAQNALGLEFQWSPGKTAQILMERMLTGQRATWGRPATFPKGCPVEVVAKNGQKKRLTDLGKFDTSKPLYLHIYDKNSMYLGACTSAKLGAGSPIHVKGPTFDASMPGIWRVSGVWRWTPELEFLVKCGYVAADGIDEAWIWEESHQSLRAWAEQIWRGIQLCGENRAARGLLKSVYTIGLGWLNVPSNERWYRPDWWSMIVSGAKAKMQYKMASLEAWGFEWVWWDTDEIGFLSNEPDPRKAVPHILSREGELGGFKIKYSIICDDLLLHALSDNCSFSQAGKLIDQMGAAARDSERRRQICAANTRHEMPAVVL